MFSFGRTALLGVAMSLPFGGTAADDSQTIVFGMGCFWGAEKRMAAIPGVLDVESGYAGGDALDASYEQVLALEQALRRGQVQTRNHAEVVRVRFDPKQVNLETILAHFWEQHDPTQGDRQGNDIGSNYRSAIYTTTESQHALAVASRDAYQQALTQAGYGAITTEIAPLRNYQRAEDYHQDYLQKNPRGYCGLGGTGVAFPANSQTSETPRLSADGLNVERQLIVFAATECPYCQAFEAEIAADWSADIPLVTTWQSQPPTGWTLEQPLFATPTIVLFKNGSETSRYTGYQGDQARFWQWLGWQILTPEQQQIAFEQGTERPFTGSHLDEKRPGAFVDPITGAALFRSDTKFDSGSGWPSFFQPVEGAITLHEDRSHGMRRVEVRSASSGIHLGHVFDDGPPPSGQRYCINGNVLKFIPDS